MAGGKIDKFTDAFIDWCKRDTAGARLQRTIVQGILAVVIAGITTGDWGVSTVVAVLMATFTAIQAAIGNNGEVK